MTKVILCLPRIPQPDHAADALAVAICHTHHNSDGMRAARDQPGGTRDRVHPRHARRRRRRTRRDRGRRPRARGARLRAHAERLVPHVGGVSLYTYLNVREDALQLFGFRNPGGARSSCGSRPSAALVQGRSRGALGVPGRGAGAGRRPGRRQEVREHAGHRQEARPASGGRAQGQGGRAAAGRRRRRGDTGAPILTNHFIEARSALRNLGRALREAGGERLRGAPRGRPGRGAGRVRRSRARAGE